MNNPTRAIASIVFVFVSVSANAQDANEAEPQVKQTQSSKMCHEKGVSGYYNRIKFFKAFDSMADCVASGGHMSKRRAKIEAKKLESTAKATTN